MRDDSQPDALKANISIVRKQVQEVVGPVGAFEERVKEVYATGKAHSAETYRQILEPENGLMRWGVIGGGALFGYAIGAMRGRFFKKLFYTSLGVASTSAACYPRTAAELTKEAWEESKKLGQIAANFVNGGESLCNVQSLLKPN